jgi:hypothetical protein
MIQPQHVNKGEAEQVCVCVGAMVFNATLNNIAGLNKYILKVSVNTVFCSDTVTAEHIVMLCTQLYVGTIIS